MKDMNNERGYALFLAVLIIAIFSILAVSLITIVVSGAYKTEIREDVTQASELSDKGLQHIVRQINKEMEDQLGEDGLPRTKYIDTLKSILQKYDCKNEERLASLNTKTGDYDVCVYDYDLEDLYKTSNDLRSVVTFRSIGEVDGRNEEIYSDVELGTRTVPDALRYVLGTIDMTEEDKNGEGNIYLHGGVELYGDVKADNHLFTFDHGIGVDQRVDEAYWRKTTLPVLYPSEGTDQAKIVLGGDLFTFKSSVLNSHLNKTGRTSPEIERISDYSFYENHLDWADPSVYEKTSVEQLFANEINLPVVTDRFWSGNRVNIDERIEEGKSKIDPKQVRKGNQLENINTSVDISFRPAENTDYVTFKDANFKFKNGEVTSGKTTRFREGNYSFNSMYVNTTLYIGNSSNSQNKNDYDDITIGGYDQDRGAQLFVDGNVIIQGANLKSNLTIYTTGSVTIRNSTIQGKEFERDREGSLIVFSKKRISIADNSLYINEPSELKGYFYSEDNLVMFGTGSYIKIHGGIAAKRITLNAIRGHYEGGNGWPYVIEPANLSSPSRLTVQYDTDLIENYLKLYPSEPIIKNIDPPELIDRDYTYD